MWRNGENPSKDELDGVLVNWKELKENHKIEEEDDKEGRKRMEKEFAYFKEMRNISSHRKNVVLDDIKKAERIMFDRSHDLKTRKEMAKNSVAGLSVVEKRRNSTVGLFEFISKHVNFKNPFLSKKVRYMEEIMRKAFAKIGLVEKHQDDVRERFEMKKEHMDKSDNEMDQMIKTYQDVNERMRDGISKASKAIERFSSAIISCKTNVQTETREHKKNADERVLLHQEQLEKVKGQVENIQLERRELLQTMTADLELTHESNVSEIAALEKEISILNERCDEEERIIADELCVLDNNDETQEELISKNENAKRLQEKLREKLCKDEKALLETREVKKQSQNELRQFAQRRCTSDENYKTVIEKQEKKIVELKADCLKCSEKSRKMEFIIESLRRDKEMEINNNAEKSLEFIWEKLSVYFGKVFVKEIGNETYYLEEKREAIRDGMNDKRKDLLDEKTHIEKSKKGIKEEKEVLQKKLKEFEKIKVICDSKVNKKGKLADESEKLKVIVNTNIEEIEKIRNEIKDKEENMEDDVVNESQVIDEEMKEEENVYESLDDKEMDLRKLYKEFSLFHRARYYDMKTGMTKYVRKTPQGDVKENNNDSANKANSGVKESQSVFSKKTASNMKEGYSVKNKDTPDMKENKPVFMKMRSVGNEEQTSKERLMTAATSVKKSYLMGDGNSVTPKVAATKESLAQTGNKRKMCKEKKDAKRSSMTEVDEIEEPDKAPVGRKRLFVPGTFGM